MTTFLNILFIGVSVLFFAGRLYEIMFITDMRTGFLLNKGVVSTPLMMSFVFLIAICCGVIIFAGDNKGTRVKKIPVGILGIMAGAFFIAGGIVNSLDCFKYGGFIGYHMMVVAAGVGLLYLGVKGVKGRKKETLPAIMVMLLPIGVCLNAVVYEIKPVADIAYLMRNMSGICTMLFFLALFKTVYAPGKLTKASLYVFSLVNFLFSGVTSIAAVFGAITTDTVVFSRLLYYVGFIFIGFYSVYVSFYIIPSSDNLRADTTDDIQTKKTVRKPVKKAVVEPVKEEVPTVQTYENSYDMASSQTSEISRATIDALFAAKDREEDKKIEELSQPTVAVPAKTVQVSMPKEKAVFRTDGKKAKSDTKKIVYKAPK